MLLKRFIPVLLSINLLLFYSHASAQGFSIEEETFSVVSSERNENMVAKAAITNPTIQPLQITWERVVNRFPAQWVGTKVCVRKECFGLEQNRSHFELAGGLTRDLDIRFVNDYQTGTAHVKVKIYQTDDSAATATYLDFYAKRPSGIQKDENQFKPSENIRVYPNPVSDYLMVKNQGNRTLRKIEVYNILGSKVLTHQPEPEAIINRVNVTDLEKGIYLIRVYGKNERVLMTKSISKRN